MNGENSEEVNESMSATKGMTSFSASFTTKGKEVSAPFNEHKVLHDLKHFLPAQSALKDFIHHNSLHAFQHMKFFPAIRKAATMFGYQVTLQLEEFRQLYRNGRIPDEVLTRVIFEEKGDKHIAAWKRKMISDHHETSFLPRIHRLRSHWKSKFGVDMDTMVHPLLFRILCSYLDQGIAVWKFPVLEGGFLETMKHLERNAIFSIFKTSQVRQRFLNDDISLDTLLNRIVGVEAYFEQYLFDQQFSHQGWSGFVSTLERQHSALLDKRSITLKELIVFELLLELDALTFALGKDFPPLYSRVTDAPLDLFAEVRPDDLSEVLCLWQKAFEWSYYDEVLSGIGKASRPEPNVSTVPGFQAVFCIDERECSLRRHIESVDPHCETLGAPGFFGVEFYFQPAGAVFYEKLCPAPVTPAYLIKEVGPEPDKKQEWLYHASSHKLLHGFISGIPLGFLAGARMLQHLFRPKMSPAISNAFALMNDRAELTIENKHPDDRENDLQIGFTIGEMASRVESQLRGMGLIKNFAQLVYIIAHGSSSANNPHHGAHDCGACSGRPGCVNARVFAAMANHAEVRKVLEKSGIVIPAATRFIAAMHDTAADHMAYYDTRKLSGEQAVLHQRNVEAFERALDLNAKERSRRFASINSKKPVKKIRKAIRNRSVSLFEPRPELGHGTNTLCIVGHRSLTKSIFLDRRAFLNSYDYRTDPEGKLLPGIMRPLGPVCGGINLEYYFSRVDNYKIGAGTKLPHNVMGLFGVANSSDGDLRPGLPLQMIEVHDPMRLLIIVEHFPDVVKRTIQSSSDMYEWYINEWVHLVVIHPETRQFYYFKEGDFILYKPLHHPVKEVVNLHEVLKQAVEMESNRIVDATKENLPVFIFK